MDLKQKGLALLTILMLFVVVGCSNDKENTTNNNNNNIDNDEPTTNNENEYDDLLATMDRNPSVETLVNKEYSLPTLDDPEDLVTIKVDTVLDNEEVNQLREVAASALYDMFQDAEEDGIKLYARSGYRSYQTQVYLFDSYEQEHGEEKANKFSAKPGHSEHQTGLVMDVTAESVDLQLTEKFGETEEGKWLASNAHRYGFIIRYPQGKEDITKYIYEPWHIRYLGVDLATAIFESGLTYEEFVEEVGILDEVIPQ